MDKSLKDKLKNLSPDQIKKIMAVNSKSETQDLKTHDIRMLRNDLEMYPMSQAQERIWFLSQLTHNTSLYNIPLVVKLTSAEISLEEYTDAFNLIIEKNEILRTTFHENNGNLSQQIHKTLKIRIDYEDISDNNFSSSSELVSEIAVNHSSKHFDLTELPLFGIKIIKSCKNEHVLIINIHHIISDGWTNSLISKDIADIFQTGVLDRENSIQYIDFVEWEQKWMKTDEYQRQLDFWNNTLSELSSNLRFPKDYFYSEHSYDGKTIVRDIPNDKYDLSLEFCKKNNITAFHFFFICYAVLIEKYIQSKDLIIGIPVAKRNQHKFKNTYGLFINSLPLRLKIDTNKSFIDTIKSCAKSIGDALSCQEVPFTQIIKSVNPDRNTKENALFNIHFAYQHISQGANSDRHALLPIDFKNSKFDINFWIEIAGQERKITVTYKSRIIGKAKIERFVNHYFNLIDEAIANPEIRINDLKIYPESDLPRLSGTKAKIEQNTWMNFYNDACKKFPNSIAIVDSNDAITYKHLDEQSDNLAILLQKQGAKKGDIVIIDIGRDINFIVAILACFKCACTYLPIENDIPPEKLKYIINDSGAKISFTDKIIPNISCINTTEFNDCTTTEIPEKVNVNTLDIAYIIYTSGTTGKPKGVKVSHKALLNYSLAMQSRINDNSLHSFAHVSAINADLGNTSIFLSIGFGGQLVIPSKESLVDPKVLSDFFEIYPIDVLKIVPSHLDSLLNEDSSNVLPKKLLICGGESLSKTLVDRIKAINPNLRIINHYGPTETTIGVLTHEILSLNDNSIIPIGKPIDNVNILILDNNHNIAPIGVQGEIYISGANNSSGYIGQDQLNKKKFIDIPTYSNERFYKTGDLAFINENKDVVFIGRSDSQIKLNGYRIELEEIENIIKLEAKTNNISVFANIDSNKNIRLYAAIKDSENLDLLELKNKLRSHLSPKFIPLMFCVDEIPLTKNGKINVKRLKEIAKDNDSQEEVLPRDLFEVRLLEIFKDMFPDTNISIEDSFFSIGGHSLLAIRLIDRINLNFKSNLNINTLFQYSSVKEIASILHSNDKLIISENNLISFFDNKRNQKIIWIHPAGGNIMCYYPIGEQLSKQFDILAISANDHNLDEIAIESLAIEYCKKIKDRDITSNFVLAGWSMGALIAYKMASIFSEENISVPVILADQPASQIVEQKDISFEARLVTYLRKVQIFSGNKFKYNYSNSQDLDYVAILAEFKRINLVPEGVKQNDFMFFLRILVKHNEIISDFIPERYDGPVLLLKAEDESGIIIDNINLSDLGWSQYCKNLTIQRVSGNHITMINPEHSVFVSKIIDNWIIDNTK